MLRLVCLSVCVAFISASNVLEFTDANFESSIADLDVALVEFYAPWCGHCKRLAPEYEVAANLLQENDPPIPLIKVDCTVETKTCGKYGVSGYPTMKIFKNGEASEYNGPRETDGIVKAMKSKAGPTSKHLKTSEEAEKFLANSELGIVAFIKEADNEFMKQFMKVASSLSDDLRFAHTTESSLLEKYGYSDDIVIFQPKRLHSKFEPSELKYDGEVNDDKIKTWINDNFLGLCGHRTTSNSEKFTKPYVVAYYEVDYVKNTKGTNYWRNRVMKIGKEFKDVTFAISNRDDFSQEMSEMGMATDSEKPVVGARSEDNKKYVMKDEFSMDNLKKFVEDFTAGKLEAYVKSENVPEDNDGPVKVLVGKNFDEIVNDNTKDVLIEFYAPWCGHCKTLAPKYDELGELLKDEDEIVIAKMDATANDVPSQFQVQGFPTLFYVPQGSKDSPKQYNGGREVKDFIEYLAKESTNPLKGYDRSGKKIEQKKTEL